MKFDDFSVHVLFFGEVLMMASQDEKCDVRSIAFEVTDGHKWLMAPKGSGALWASKSLQESLEPVIISSDNSPATKFQDRFDYIGTRDYTPWCAMAAAMDFRELLGGEDSLQGYTTKLARWAGEMMAEAFSTETVVPSSMIPSMFAVRLPIPVTWPTDLQAACAGSIAGGLITRYQMQVISFGVNETGLTHWIRVSSQIYLEQTDFHALTEAVLTLRQSCKSGREQDLDSGSSEAIV